MSFARVDYAAGGRLDARDLAAVEADRNDRLDRHQALAHRAGPLLGLQLEPVGATVRVTPGVGLDAAGRLVRLAEPVEVVPPPEGFVTEVEVVAVETEVVPQRRGRVEVRSGTTGRRSWVAEVRTVQLPAGKTVVARRPGDAEPGQFPPSEPVAPSIYLGRVEHGTAGLTINRTGVSNAGVAAETIRAPSGAFELTLGLAPEATRPHFAVRGADRLPHLEIAPDGHARLTGGLTAGGVKARKVRFAQAAPADSAPGPWGLARVAVEQEGAPPREVMRLGLADPGKQGDPAARRMSIGRPDAVQLDTAAPGTPLVVAAGGEVRVRGLNVEGQRIREPVGPDPSEPAFAQAVVDAMLAGLAAGLAQSFVAGRVLSAVASPIAGAAVQLLGLDLATAADAEGRFLFQRVGWPGQIVFVRVEADGFEPRVSVAIVGASITIVLEEA